MSWIQRGSDIDGEATNDGSGYSVSLNSTGDVVAIGAVNNDGNGSNSGHVRVYSWNGSSWVQRGTDIDGEATGDTSGFSVSLNSTGDVVAIGAVYNDGNGSESGHVRVYSWNGSSWIQRGSDINGEAAGDWSGYSVSLNSTGDVVAIGAPSNDGNGSNSGHVRVYSWNGSSWVQRGTDIDGEATGDDSGHRVSLNSTGDVVAIGAVYNDGNGAESGHVRIYSWNGSSWIQRGVDIDGEAAGDYSGWSVSLNSTGNVVAIGAINNDGNGSSSGHVRVYSWNGSSWVQRGVDIDGEAAGDLSGYSVSLNSNGDMVAIGSPYSNSNSGHVRVYYWNGSSWVQRGSDIDGEAILNYSGRSVSLNSTGDVVAIAANNDGNGNNSGHVRVYSYTTTTTTTTTTTAAPTITGSCHNKQYSVIQLRRGLESQFVSSNIVLASGEPGYAVDSQIFKIGDGVTPWNDLLNINSWNVDQKEPDGFVNRTDSQIGFDVSNLTFSISPKSPATKYVIYNDGIKVTKSSTESLVLPSSTALYYIHFDKSNNSLSYKTTGFNFTDDIPVAQIYYNASDHKAVYFGEERHGIVMDRATHEYLHNVLGTQYINGLSISNYSTGGDGSSNSDASFSISNGLIFDEDIKVTITHSNTPSNPFEQVLYPSAIVPTYYKTGSSGIWTNVSGTYFPLKVGTTAQYNLYSGGSWSASDSPNPNNNRYVAAWICSTSQENAPIISIMGQRIDSSLEQAKSNNDWSSLNLNGLPIIELRPLYRLIYDTKSSFTNSAKAFLSDILDIRSHIDTITGLPQNDHGNLYGLADDDHYQYVHIDNARTITANHTFSNNINVGGIINANSGNFDSIYVTGSGVIDGNIDVTGSGNFGALMVNGTPVSVSGHFHMPRVSTLTYNATLNTNAASGDMFDVTLTGNTTLANPVSGVNGQTIRWRITQDGTGNRGVTLDNKFVIPISATSPLPFSTGINLTDMLAATYHSGRDKWDVVAFIPGY